MRRFLSVLPRSSVVPRLLLGAAALVGILLVVPPLAADGPAAGAAREFATVEEAAKALVDAAAANDDAALNALAGGNAADVVQDGKDPQVAKDRAAFAAAAKKSLTFEKSEEQVTIVVGDEQWPFPIPLVKSGDKWRFDAEEGRTEILARRIGQNELRAIASCREYVNAQTAYAAKDRDGDKVREYAQRLVSSPGKQDGLWWAAKDGQEASPLGAALATFKDHVQDAATGRAPFQGYYWRVLTAQGANAPGGAYSYLINGNMIAGFGLIGYPAEYRNTGVMTLVVSNHGTIFQKDLGADSAAAATAIAAFDPDASWTAVSNDDLVASEDK